MAQIIVAATPFHGHVTPLYAVAADLSRRGHEVLFLTGARFAEKITESGMRFVALDPSADFDDRVMSDEFPEFATVAPGPQLHIFFWQRVFADAAVAQYHQLRQILADFPATVLIHDTIFLGALPFPLREPAATRPTTVCVGVLPPMLLSADAPPFTTGQRPLPGPGAADRHRQLNEEIRTVYAGMQHYIEQVLAQVDVKLPGFIFDCVTAAPDHYLQLTAPGFEFPRSDAPETFRCVGALPQQPTPGFQQPTWWPELADDRPVVVVTQGTLANEDLSELIEPTVRGLAGMDLLLVVATARPDGPTDLRRSLPNLPDNARVEGYIPFDQLLPHADVLVTNGGYGGVQAALRNGVPLVVCGDTEDKPDVAARVEWSGVGLDLRTGHPGPDAVAAAVRKVLGDDSFRRNARALQDELSRFDPLGTIADLVEAHAPGRARR